MIAVFCIIVSIIAQLRTRNGEGEIINKYIKQKRAKNGAFWYIFQNCPSRTEIFIDIYSQLPLF